MKKSLLKSKEPKTLAPSQSRLRALAVERLGSIQLLIDLIQSLSPSVTGGGNLATTLVTTRLKFFQSEMLDSTKDFCVLIADYMVGNVFVSKKTSIAPIFVEMRPAVPPGAVKNAPESTGTANKLLDNNSACLLFLVEASLGSSEGAFDGSDAFDWSCVFFRSNVTFVGQNRPIRTLRVIVDNSRFFGSDMKILAVIVIPLLV